MNAKQQSWRVEVYLKIPVPDELFEGAIDAAGSEFGEIHATVHPLEFEFIAKVPATSKEEAIDKFTSVLRAAYSKYDMTIFDACAVPEGLNKPIPEPTNKTVH
jgi:hypothetical protein